jgi:hypothetical protein
VVRRKDVKFKLKNSTVANLRKLFEPSHLTRGLTEGPSLLFSAARPKLYTPEQDLENCVSQQEARKQTEPRDILDLGSGASQDWLETPKMICTGPIEEQDTGVLARDVKKREI